MLILVRFTVLYTYSIQSNGVCQSNTSSLLMGLVSEIGLQTNNSRLVSVMLSSFQNVGLMFEKTKKKLMYVGDYFRWQK